MRVCPRKGRKAKPLLRGKRKHFSAPLISGCLLHDRQLCISRLWAVYRLSNAKLSRGQSGGALPPAWRSRVLRLHGSGSFEHCFPYLGFLEDFFERRAVSIANLRTPASIRAAPPRSLFKVRVEGDFDGEEIFAWRCFECAVDAWPTRSMSCAVGFESRGVWIGVPTTLTTFTRLGISSCPNPLPEGLAIKDSSLSFLFL